MINLATVHLPRFMGLLSLFTFFMLVLITGSNLLQLFVGWEGMLQCLKWCINTHNSNSNFHTKRNGYSKGLERIGPHDLKYLSLIVGSVLGDSHLEKRTVSGGTRVIFEQCSSNVNYLRWFHHTLALGGYVNPAKPKLKTRIGAGNKVRYYYRISSYTFNSLNFLHEGFYVNGRKTVFNDLETYLTPLALAVWYMDDGSYIKSSKTGKIATNNFTYEEIKTLCNILKVKFNLNCNIFAPCASQGVKGSYVLYITKESFISFVQLIEPFLVDSMKYKLGYC